MGKDGKKKQPDQVLEEPQDQDLGQKTKELEDQLKRALADYQNLEKRVQEERVRWAHMANRDLLLRLLPAVDMLMLAKKHTQDQGITMSIAHLLEALKAEGVEQILTEGKQFNPELMEVVETVKGENGKVVEEVRSGYLLFGKPLRVAQVKVGKAS